MKPAICESNWLPAFLEGTLSGPNERELVQHLDECESCALELEQLAADSSRWQEARSHLASSPSSASLALPGNESENLPFAVRHVLALLDPTDNPKSLGRIGSYEVVGVVGNGAMGVVLKAFDRTLDRIVALKVMNPTLAACGTARHRFAREAKAAAAVLHPNVIAIHGVSTDRELPFLVMPYIAGMSLQQRMNRQGPLSLTETLRIGSQIAAGLAAAHQQGLIHRDIKPSNVMLDEGVESALITDFGLARTIDDATMTRSGAITGTPEYMSPEQARGDDVDCASDIFSLGSLLYAVCSGTRPFRAKTSFGVLRKITDEHPKPIREINPDVPTWLCTLINRMLSKSPAQRPTATQVRELLEGCLAHIYQPDRIPLPRELSPSDSRPFVFSSKTFLTGTFLIMTLIFIALLASAIQPGKVALETAKASSFALRQQEETDQPSVFKTWNLKFPDQDQMGTLNIDINRGSIEVTGHDKPGVVIEVLTPPEFEKSDAQGSKLQKVYAPKYDLDTDKKKNLIKLDTYNQSFVLNLRIKVPYKTNLILDTYMDGHLKVSDVSGTIRTRTQHSDIQLTNIKGSATAYSRNGNLTIGFQKVASDAKLDFESYNGNIRLAMPESVEVTAAISSGQGSYSSEFQLDSISENERPKSILAKVKSNVDEYQFKKINGGGVPLRIESEKGSIKLLKSMKPIRY